MEQLLTYRDLIIYYLQRDYKILTQIIERMVDHVEKLYDNNIISSEIKKKSCRSLSEIINKLNETYNNVLIKIEYGEKFITQDNSNIQFDNLDVLINNFTNNENIPLEATISMIDILRINNMTQKFFPGVTLSNLTDIEQSLMLIMKDIGTSNFEDFMRIYKIQDNSVTDINYTNKINLLKTHFIILKVSDENENVSDELTVKINNNELKYEFLLENIYDIEVFSINEKKSYKVNGYFKIDCINSTLRTCQVSKEYLYEKKKKILDVIETMNNINKGFKDVYIKNFTIGDILSLETQNIKKRVTDDYQKFIKYSNMNFKTIMAEFLESSLKTKYEIIKLLLMGQINVVNIAGLLFGVTKDSKESIDSSSKPTLISDLIYKHLNYPLQVKLRNSGSTINEELEKLKSMNSDDIDLKKQIITNKNMPKYVKKIALEKIEEMKSGSSEYYKQLQYVKIIIDYPWIGENDEDIFSALGGDRNKSKDFLDKIKVNLNKKVYGHTKCKETIIELVAKWTSNPESLGKVIGLRGPPGVGKTLFAKTLGDALGIPFTQINIGGVDDGSVLSGHSFTYSSAQPGLIVKKMISAGSPRCIMFFDEVDKTGAKHGINEVTNVLIHATDHTSNDKFNDKFLQEIGFPLNKVLFIFSYNNRDKVDRILLDRIEEIDVGAYNLDDKINITKDHLLNDITKDIGIETESIQIEDEAICYLVESFTVEPGVRELKRKLEKIITKMNVDRVYSKEPFDKIDFNKDNPIKINKEIVDKYLIKPNILVKKIHDTDEIGVINGLYATTIGLGGVLPILVYKNYSNKKGFNLKLTGSQKRVMRESIMFSLTIAMNLVKDKYIEKFLQNNPCGLHIHTPDGATPKDGPSAGSAFTTALISRILHMRIKHDIAMTGEIEANGSITAIGGLEYKLSGAKRAGVKLVFVPKENKPDYERIIKANDKLIDNNFKIIIVEHITEVLNYALLDSNIVSKLNKKGKSNLTYEKTFEWKTYLDKNKNSNDYNGLLLETKNIPTKTSKKNKKKYISESENESSDNETSDNRSSDNETSDNRSSDNETSDNGSSDNETSENESSEDETSDNESSEDESSDE